MLLNAYMVHSSSFSYDTDSELHDENIISHLGICSINLRGNICGTEGVRVSAYSIQISFLTTETAVDLLKIWKGKKKIHPLRFSRW